MVNYVEWLSWLQQMLKNEMAENKFLFLIPTELIFK